MKLRNLAALVVAMSLPLAAASAQDNLFPMGTDTQANIEAAKDRLDKARVRLEISQKQVDAAKARLKAADAEFKAARANHDARNLEHRAKKLSDASGLPEITEGQIEQNRTRSLALKEPEADKEAAQVAPAAPVDLSQTRLQQVDFNAQPEESAPVAPPAEAPVDEPPAPDKQAVVEPPAYHAAPPQVAATSTPTVIEAPIVP